MITLCYYSPPSPHFMFLLSYLPHASFPLPFTDHFMLFAVLLE